MAASLLTGRGGDKDEPRAIALLRQVGTDEAVKAIYGEDTAVKARFWPEKAVKARYGTDKAVEAIFWPDKAFKARCGAHKAVKASLLSSLEPFPVRES